MTATLLNANQQRATPFGGNYTPPPPVTPRNPQNSVRTWGSRDYLARLETFFQNRSDITGIGILICNPPTDIPVDMNYTNTRDDAVLALVISADVYQSGTGSGTLSQFNVGGSIVIGRRPLDDFHLNSLAEADDGAAVYYLQLP